MINTSLGRRLLTPALDFVVRDVRENDLGWLIVLVAVTYRVRVGIRS